MTKPKVAISSCLLGEKVRFDGQHKRDDWITDELGKFVNWVPLCPEVLMGLGVPRETIQLQDHEGQIALVNAKSKKDLTKSALATAQKIYPDDFDVEAYIWKKSSPSCGLEKVKVHKSEGGMPLKNGRGVFAGYFSDKFPEVIGIEEGRFSDVAQREFFLIKLFLNFRFKSLKNNYKSYEDFQRTNKLLMMALSPQSQKNLGKILAKHKTISWVDLCLEYQNAYAGLLKSPWRVSRQVNVLEHILGYFKTHLTASEKKLIKTEISAYLKARVPLLVPLRILYHLSEKYQVKYLLDQSYFSPYPNEINLNV
jgi:uncharacterized protein YbbK (DUF523 family)/uncharacterized protein YbgA (DUF1722 family)